MLELLKIKNIAIIENIEVSFKPGLNILSGETGAGKSIVVEAISLLLGSRATSDRIRTQAHEGSVEGLFDLKLMPWINERLHQAGFPSCDQQLLIKRILSKNGKHRIYINGELATLHSLQNICDGLIDLCGQHEHQLLTRNSYQLELLDRYGANQKTIEEYSKFYLKLQALEIEKSQLQNLDQNKKLDFLKFQLNEIVESKLTLGEDENLANEKNLLQSSEIRNQNALAAYTLLASTEEKNLLDLLKTILSKIKTIHSNDSTIEPLVVRIEQALFELDEASIELKHYCDQIESDPKRIEYVLERLSLITKLKKKYGGTLESVFSYKDELESNIHTLENSQIRLSQIEHERDLTLKKLSEVAQTLTSLRKKTAKHLSDSVSKELKELRMREAQFEAQLIYLEDPKTWKSNGANTLDFLVQTNLGENLMPIGKIASGGELSRLMLAIRRVISEKGCIGVYLFDEIDAGIGGETAIQVGKKLKSVSKHNQVICITHLPQVAAFADHHLNVQKTVQKGRTLTEIKTLNPKTKRAELARMFSGQELSKASLASADELIRLASL